MIIETKREIGMTSNSRERMIELLKEGDANEVRELIHNEGCLLEDEFVFKAIKGGSVECLNILLENGASLSIRTLFNDTPLMVAAKNARLEMVKFLIPISDCKAQNDLEDTALIEAAKKGVPEVVSRLVERSDVLHQNEDGYTALAGATDENQIENIKILAPYGGADTEDLYGWIPLKKAIFKRSEDCVAALLPFTKLDDEAWARNGLDDFLMKYGTENIKRMVEGTRTARVESEILRNETRASKAGQRKKL